jgi:hypothetical protein
MANFIRKLFNKSKFEVTPDYQKWREVIFSIKPEVGGISTNEAEQVYGVVMDLGLVADDSAAPSGKNLVISVTAFATGESSMRPSFGGGMIGLGSQEEISEHAKYIIRAAQTLVGTAQNIDKHDLPESGHVFFYLLTTSGLKLYQCKLSDLKAPNHPFNELFSRFSSIKRRADALWNQSHKK